MEISTVAVFIYLFVRLQYKGTQLILQRLVIIRLQQLKYSIG